jgi:hypothetical protein
VFAKHFVDCVVVKLRVPDPWYLELFRETRSRVPGKFFGLTFSLAKSDFIRRFLACNYFTS